MPARKVAAATQSSRGHPASKPARPRKARTVGVTGSNRTALTRTLTALRELGRLEPVDDALVALCESAADAVDASPGRASLVKEYRECLILLGGLGTDGGDEFHALLGRLSAAVADEETPGT